MRMVEAKAAIKLNSSISKTIRCRLMMAILNLPPVFLKYCQVSAKIREADALNYLHAGV